MREAVLENQALIDRFREQVPGAKKNIEAALDALIENPGTVNLPMNELETLSRAHQTFLMNARRIAETEEYLRGFDIYANIQLLPVQQAGVR